MEDCICFKFLCAFLCPHCAHWPLCWWEFGLSVTHILWLYHPCHVYFLREVKKREGGSSESGLCWWLGQRRGTEQLEDALHAKLNHLEAGRCFAHLSTWGWQHHLPLGTWGRVISCWPVLYAGWILQNAGGGTGFLLTILQLEEKKNAIIFWHLLLPSPLQKKIFLQN